MTAGDAPRASCVIYSDRVALPTGLAAATVTVEDGIIARIQPGRAPPGGDVEFVDCGSRALLPGLIDVLRGKNVYRGAVEGGFAVVVHLPSRFDGPEVLIEDPLSCDVIIAGRATAAHVPHVAEVPTGAPCDDVNGAVTDALWLRAQVDARVLLTDAVTLTEAERDLASPFHHVHVHERPRAPSPMARLPLCKLDGAQASPSRRLKKKQSSEDEDPWVQSLLQAELASYNYSDTPVSSPKPRAKLTFASPPLVRSQTVPNPQRLIPCAKRRPTYPPSPEKAVFVRTPSLGQLVKDVSKITCPILPPPRRRPRASSEPTSPVRTGLGISRSVTTGTLDEQREPRFARRRPREISIFKDCDDNTRRAIRRDYSLLARAHPSRLQARGLRWLLQRRVKGARLHITDVAAAQTIVALKHADARPTSATNVLYLLLAAEEVPNGATRFKFAPPLRHSGHQQVLWDALRDGTLDCVHSGTDAVASELKCADVGDFARAAPGTCARVGADALSVLWARARREGFGLEDLVLWLATNPARALGLSRYGSIAVGKAASFCVFDAEADGVAKSEALKALPALGRVEATFVRGRVAYRRGGGGVVAPGRVVDVDGAGEAPSW